MIMDAMMSVQIRESRCRFIETNYSEQRNNSLLLTFRMLISWNCSIWYLNIHDELHR